VILTFPTSIILTWVVMRSARLPHARAADAERLGNPSGAAVPAAWRSNQGSLFGQSHFKRGELHGKIALRLIIATFEIERTPRATGMPP
jgi:hypothetical protein